jgi:hypothetical protein
LSAAYITYKFGPNMAVSAGLWHEIQTTWRDLWALKGFANLRDSKIDINNNLLVQGSQSKYGKGTAVGQT